MDRSVLVGKSRLGLVMRKLDCSNGGTLLQLWSDWSDWLPCSASCGEGIQIRVRKCIAGNCPKLDSVIDQRRCVLRPCPEWTSWSDWSDCLTCERKEVRHRERHCRIGLIQADAEGHECPGGAKEIETCDISCEISTFTSDKKSRRKVNTSDR
ncbi:unnamed protein product, partial [Brugia timori]|uniref:TSP1_spondin domain-containing protein n=1 Tax=Brugia timori TaxID=42155 RepID=A0A0R3QIM8_9BILA